MNLIDIKFLWNNFIHPFDKITISLGTEENGIRLKNAFKKRSWKRAFVPYKKYNCSVVNLQDYTHFEEYIQTVKGKNSTDYFSRRAQKMGYYWQLFDPNKYIDEIYNINTSANERQGREMDSSYREKVSEWPSDDYNCWVGVFDMNDRLVSYVWLVYAN